MWTANAATVSPAPDTADGRCHLTPANLVTMLHRAQEWPETKAQLDLAFADARHFAVHDAVPPSFGDEGAANHMRLCEGMTRPASKCSSMAGSGGRFPGAPARTGEPRGRAPATASIPHAAVFIEQNPRSDRRRRVPQ